MSAEHLRQVWRGELRAAVAVDDEDEIGGLLDKGGEPTLGSPGESSLSESHRGKRLRDLR